jgi:hypothetical protein
MARLMLLQERNLPNSPRSAKRHPTDIKKAILSAKGCSSKLLKKYRTKCLIVDKYLREGSFQFGQFACHKLILRNIHPF